MARNESTSGMLERLFDDILKGIWNLFCGLVKLVFRLLGAGIGALYRKATGKPSTSTSTPENVSEAQLEALAEQTVEAYGAVKDAHDSKDWKRTLALADQAMPLLIRLHRSAEAEGNDGITDVRFMAACVHYMRWDARAYLIPVIKNPDPGESDKSCMRRCQLRDEDLLKDLTIAGSLIDKAIAGPKPKHIEAENLLVLGTAIWSAVGRNLRYRDPDGAFSAQKRSIELDPNKADIKGLDVVGRTAKAAGRFAEFEELADGLIAGHPGALQLRVGAAEPFWSAAVAINKLDAVQRNQLLEKQIQLLAKARKHLEYYLFAQPDDVDSIHLYGRVLYQQGNYDEIDALLPRLRELEKTQPVTNTEIVAGCDSRHAHLVRLLESKS